VVILSRDQSLGSHLEDQCGRDVALTLVPTGYEAAAEILAAPAAAVVIDFRALGPAHRPLLEIARRMHLEVLGTGSLPTGPGLDGFRHVRLVAPEELPRALRGLVGDGRPPATDADTFPAAPGADTPPAPEPPPAEADPPRPPAKAARSGRKKPIKVPRAARKRASSTRRARRAPERSGGPRPGDVPPAAPPGASASEPAPGRLSDLLSPEELAALLEDEP